MNTENDLSPDLESAIKLLDARDPLVGEDFINGVLVRSGITGGVGADVSRPRQVSYGWVKYPLMLAACSLLAFTGWHLTRNAFQSSQNAYNTYTTRAGQRASITLRDGSRVTLGPATTLRVQDDPRNTSSSTLKEVTAEVTGDALFSINHSAAHTFTVKAHGVTTRVLGTEFVVRAYDASLVRVAVRDGRVSVQSSSLTESNAAVISAGEAAVITPNTLPTVGAIVDLDTEFAWARGELVLREVPLGEAVNRLSRWYNMEFRVADPMLLERRVNGAFTSSFNMPIIQDLAKAMEARVVLSGNILTFSSKR